MNHVHINSCLLYHKEMLSHAVKTLYHDVSCHYWSFETTIVSYMYNNHNNNNNHSLMHYDYSYNNHSVMHYHYGYNNHSLVHCCNILLFVIILIQYCPGGELFDYIVAREKLRVMTMII